MYYDHLRLEKLMKLFFFTIVLIAYKDLVSETKNFLFARPILEGGPCQGGREGTIDLKFIFLTVLDLGYQNTCNFYYDVQNFSFRKCT